jgi:SPP1 gp7 family putative phage head morphogenesis protein
MSLSVLQESEELQLRAIKKIITLFTKQRKIVEERLNEINALTAFDKEALIRLRNGAISNSQRINVVSALSELEQAYINSDPVKGAALRARELAKFSRERTELQAYQRELEIRLLLLQKQVDDLSVKTFETIRKDAILREAYAEARETGQISVPRVRRLLTETTVNIASKPSGINTAIKNVRVGTYTHKLVDKFGKNIKDSFLTGITRGDSYKTIADNLSRQTGMSQRAAMMFIRTEGNAVMNESTRKVILSNDLVKGYIFKARLDSRTSKICQDLDGQYFTKEEMQPGVNFPPTHFSCRSHTKIVKVDDNEKALIKDKYAKSGNEMLEVSGSMTEKEFEAAVFRLDTGSGKSGGDVFDDNAITVAEFTKKYNIPVSPNVTAFGEQKTRTILAGIDDAVKEYGGQIKIARIDAEKLNSDTMGELVAYPNQPWETPYIRLNETKIAKNTQEIKNTAYHEAIHAMEYTKGSSWNISKRVVEEARKEMGWRVNSDEYKNELLRIFNYKLGIYNTERHKTNEIIAYALERKHNGKNSPFIDILSKKFKEAIKDT